MKVKKFQIYWAQYFIDTHHKRLHVIFTGSCEWMITCKHLCLGSTNFPKTFRPLQKHRCQKSDIQEVHSVKFRHSLGFVAHMIWKCLRYVCHLTQSCKWLSSLGTLEMQSPHEFWRLYTLKSKTLIVEKTKHDILSVSKSVAWYQKNMHIKACLVMGYTGWFRRNLHYFGKW